MFGQKTRAALAEAEQRIEDLETENRTYSDIVTNALLDAAMDTAGDAYISALETSAGALSRAFTAAIVTGAGGAISPWVMAQIGRGLVEAGESVWHRVGMRLERVDNYDFPGRTITRYNLNMTDGRVIQADASRVLHVRWNVNIHNGRGLGPLMQARALRTMMQRLEESMSDELSAAVGYLLPIPDDGQSENVQALRDQIAALKGKIAVIETARAGWGQGPAQGPRRELDLQRLGPNIPASSVDLYQAARNAVFAACGYPVALVGIEDGTAQREAWRRYLHGTVAPLGRLVVEAAGMAGLNISIAWDNLFASDIQGRARAFQSLVASGMSLERAAAASGILEPAD
ncbi:MAG: hypothetical protein OXI11_05140 [Gammaproteobacteria bacterium]|nr:hypothetical protein [Gammaproteobacteria bacterium]